MFWPVKEGGFVSQFLSAIHHPRATETLLLSVPLVGTWYLYWLVVEPYPSEKYESQLGWLFPIYGKIKKCSKPPTNKINKTQWNSSILAMRIGRMCRAQNCMLSPCFFDFCTSVHSSPKHWEKIFAVGLMSAACSLHGLMDGTRLAILCYIQLKLDELQKNHNWHKEINDCNLGFPITGKLYDITWHPLRYVVDTGNWRIQTQGSSRNRLWARTFTFQEVASVGAPMRLMHGILLEQQLSLSVS